MTCEVCGRPKGLSSSRCALGVSGYFGGDSDCYRLGYERLLAERASGVAEERERCAREAERYRDAHAVGDSCESCRAAKYIAARIRSGKEE